MTVACRPGSSVGVCRAQRHAPGRPAAGTTRPPTAAPRTKAPGLRGRDRRPARLSFPASAPAHRGSRPRSLHRSGAASRRSPGSGGSDRRASRRRLRRGSPPPSFCLPPAAREALRPPARSLRPIRSCGNRTRARPRRARRLPAVVPGDRAVESRLCPWDKSRLG